MGSARQQHRPFRDSVLYLAVNYLALLLLDKRPDDRILLVRVSNLHSLCIGGEFFTELIIYWFFYNHPGSTHTYLSLMEKCSKACNLNCLLHIKIFKKDQWIFAAHLQSVFLKTL